MTGPMSAETSGALAHLTQETFDAYKASLRTDLRVARAHAEGAWRAADAAEEAAADATRDVRDGETRLKQILDTVRDARPDLTVPTFEDATKNLEEYR